MAAKVIDSASDPPTTALIRLVALAAIASIGMSPSALASEPDVRDLLERHCVECHNAEVSEGNFNLRQTAWEWEQRAKPAAPQAEPDDIQDKKLYFEKFALMLSMAQLALETDSTRIVTLMVDAFATPVFQLNEARQTTDGYHNLSHHGQAEEKVEQLKEADQRQMTMIGEVMRNLAQRSEGDQRLLDRTMILYGSNVGDANTHDNTNLPILLAGGGFQHGQHLAFDREQNTPLSNLFVSMLQQLGLETDAFGSSGGTLTGLPRS